MGYDVYVSENRAVDQERLMVLKTRHQGDAGGMTAVVESGEFYKLLELAGRGLASEGLVKALEEMDESLLKPWSRDVIGEVRTLLRRALGEFKRSISELEVASLDNQPPTFYEDPGNY